MKPTPKKKTAQPKLHPDTSSVEEVLAHEEETTIRLVREMNAGLARVQLQAQSRYYAVLVFDTDAHVEEFMRSCGAANLVKDGMFVDGHQFAARIGHPLKLARPNLRPAKSPGGRWTKHIRRVRG